MIFLVGFMIGSFVGVLIAALACAAALSSQTPREDLVAGRTTSKWLQQDAVSARSDRRTLG